MTRYLIDRLMFFCLTSTNGTVKLEKKTLSVAIVRRNTEEIVFALDVHLILGQREIYNDYSE